MGISREQALDCFRSDDLIGIGMEADAVRRRLHPEGVVSYAMERTVDVSGAASGERLERICGEIRETIEMGGCGVRLAGLVDGRANGCGIERLEGMLRGVRASFPAIWLEGVSAAEVAAMARGCGLGVRETIARLRDAGLDSIAGDTAGGIGGLAQGVAQEWAEVHRAAHGAGMRTTAAMVFGWEETIEQRVDLLEAVRRLQEETGGFAAFLPVAAAAPGGRDLDGVTAVERLKTLAVSRMFLDNVENVQTSGSGQGLKVLQTGLHFGANDAGAVTPGGESAKDGGAASRATEENLRRVIRDAGFKPVQRDMVYRTMFLN
jgi:cyclic dehypoxanthinyl futalosine synthase